jgi:hypothetical protein
MSPVVLRTSAVGVIVGAVGAAAADNGPSMTVVRTSEPVVGAQHAGPVDRIDCRPQKAKGRRGQMERRDGMAESRRVEQHSRMPVLMARRTVTDATMVRGGAPDGARADAAVACAHTVALDMRAVIVESAAMVRVASVAQRVRVRRMQQQLRQPYSVKADDVAERTAGESNQGGPTSRRRREPSLASSRASSSAMVAVWWVRSSCREADS